jgi:hypothetical protein
MRRPVSATSATFAPIGDFSRTLEERNIAVEHKRPLFIPLSSLDVRSQVSTSSG